MCVFHGLVTSKQDRKRTADHRLPRLPVLMCVCAYQSRAFRSPLNCDSARGPRTQPSLSAGDSCGRGLSWLDPIWLSRLAEDEEMREPFVCNGVTCCTCRTFDDGCIILLDTAVGPPRIFGSERSVSTASKFESVGGRSPLGIGHLPMR